MISNNTSIIGTSLSIIYSYSNIAILISAKSAAGLFSSYDDTLNFVPIA